MEVTQELNNDDWVTCPYNPIHRVPRLRIQKHLIKCEEVYPPLSICPYNATHRYPKEKFREHLQNCPQKPIQEVDKKKKQGGLIMAPKPILQSDYLPETNPNYECWD